MDVYLDWERDATNAVYATTPRQRRRIGIVQKVPASEKPEYQWCLLYLKPTNVFKVEGFCKTERGAQRALITAWTRWIDAMDIMF